MPVLADRLVSNFRNSHVERNLESDLNVEYMYFGLRKILITEFYE